MVNQAADFMMINLILLALVPTFFVIVLGYCAGRLGIVENHHVDGLNAFVMNFALPAALFMATASAPRADLIEQASLFLILGFVMLTVHLAWYSLARLWWDASKADAALQALTISFPNLAGVGLPIAAAVLGQSGTVPVALALAAGSMIVSPLALLVVELNTSKPSAKSDSSGRIWEALSRSVTKPVVLAPALGILYSVAGLDLPSLLSASLKLVGLSAPGVALFLTGLVLSSQPFRLNWKVVIATAIGDIGRPALTAAVALALPIPLETAKVAILIAAVPSGFFGILFAVNYRLDSGVIGSMVIASTLFSAVTLSAAIAILLPF
jgi:malonate transporter and related proteins